MHSKQPNSEQEPSAVEVRGVFLRGFHLTAFQLTRAQRATLTIVGKCYDKASKTIGLLGRYASASAANRWVLFVTRGACVRNLI